MPVGAVGDPASWIRAVRIAVPGMQYHCVLFVTEPRFR